MHAFDLEELALALFVRLLVVVWRLACPVQHQRPLAEEALIVSVVPAWNVLDSELPRPTRRFSPGVSGHEWPAGESVLVLVIVGSLAQDHRS